MTSTLSVPEPFDILAHARAIHQQKQRRLTWVGAGAALLILGLLSRSTFVRLALGAAGGALLMRGMTNRKLKDNLHRAKQRVQRVQRERYRFGNGKRDLVDEASWESFPASDPPSYHGR